jgi:hypothetical protein
MGEKKRAPVSTTLFLSLSLSLSLSLTHTLVQAVSIDQVSFVLLGLFCITRSLLNY